MYRNAAGSKWQCGGYPLCTKRQYLVACGFRNGPLLWLAAFVCREAIGAAKKIGPLLAGGFFMQKNNKQSQNIEVKSVAESSSAASSANETKPDGNEKSANGKGNLTKRLVLTAAFIALATVANAYITVRVGTLFKFSPVLAIYFFAGYYLGAPLGFLVGAAGDVLGWLLFTDGAYNPLIGLSNALCCLIPALMFGLKRPVKTTYLKFALKAGLAYLVCFLLCTVGITSYGIWLYTAYIQGKYETLIAWFIYRAGAQVLNNVSNYVVTLLLFLPLSKIRYLERQ